MPVADKVTQLCEALLKKDKPFACLIPSDLVHYIARRRDKSVDANLAQKVEQCQKLVLLAPGLTWLIYGLSPMQGKTVLLANMGIQTQSKATATKAMGPIQPDMDTLVQLAKDEGVLPIHTPFPARGQWIKDQGPALSAYDPSTLSRAADGLTYYRKEQYAQPLIVVPIGYRDNLIRWCHTSMCHLSGLKVYNRLCETYHWHGMRQQCINKCKDCHLCNLLKAKRNLAHGYYRAKLFCTPHTNYAMDYYGVRSNKRGYNNVLGVVDLSTGNLVLKAVQNRTAANTAHTLLYDVVCHKGVPLTIHSDAAAEFIGGATKALSMILGCTQTTTKAHNPMANSKIERVWEFVSLSLRQMTDSQYENFHLYMPILAHVWNTTTDSDTGITPFEAASKRAHQ